MLKEIIIPEAMPAQKVPGYQMPKDKDHLLSWRFVPSKWSRQSIIG